MSDNVSQQTVISNFNLLAQILQKRAGRRKRVKHGGALCSSCYEVPPRPGQGYCADCHSKHENARQKAKRNRTSEQA